MEKEFTLQTEFTFVVKEECVGDASFKEALEKGNVRIKYSRIALTEPDGYKLNNDEVLGQIREALIYGLKEKA